MKLKIADIKIEDRLRLTDDAAVADLAASLKMQGQLQAVVVWQRLADGAWILAAGAHRIKAAEALGWTKIEATDLGFRPDQTDEERTTRARLAEIDENMRRRNLSQLEVDVCRQMLLDCELKLFHIEDVLYAEAEAENALFDERKKREALKAAKDEDDRKRIAKELRKAEDERRNAKKRADSRAEMCPLGAENGTQDELPRYQKRGVGKVIEQVAAQTGVSKTTYRHTDFRIKGVGGMDEARELFGTSLTSKGEVSALGTLKREFPDEAARLVERAKQGVNVSASGTLGRLRKDKAEAAAEAKRQATLGNVELAMHEAAKMVHKAIDIFLQVEKLIVAAPQHEKTELRQMYTRGHEWMRRAEQYKAVASAKPRGDEKHKYQGVTPKQSAQRAQAKKDQAANAKKSRQEIKP